MNRLRLFGKKFSLQGISVHYWVQCGTQSLVTMLEGGSANCVKIKSPDNCYAIGANQYSAL